MGRLARSQQGSCKGIRMKRNDQKMMTHSRLKTVQFSGQELSSLKELKRKKLTTDPYECDLLAEESRKTELLMEKLKLRYYHIQAQVPRIRLKTEMSDQKKTMDLFFNPNLLTKSKFEPEKKFAHSGLTKDLKIEQVEDLLKANKSRLETNKNGGLMFVNELWDMNYYQKILRNSQLLRKVRNLQEMKPKNKEEIFTNFKKHFSLKHAADKNDYMKNVIRAESPKLGKRSESRIGFFTEREGDLISLQKVSDTNQDAQSPRRALTSMQSRENCSTKLDASRHSVLDLARLKRLRMKNFSSSLTTEGFSQSGDTVCGLVTPRSFNISQVISECEAFIHESKECHKQIQEVREKLLQTSAKNSRVTSKTKAVEKQIEREIQRSFKDRQNKNSKPHLSGHFKDVRTE